MDPSAEEMAALATRLSTLASSLANTPDEPTKKALQQELVLEAKKTIWQVQAPFDGIMDHTVNAYTNGCISALLEIGVFDAIPPTGSATVKEIAEKCDADETLIIRLMRQLVCVNIFVETSLNEWCHNKRSIGLSDHVGLKTGKYFFQVSHEEMFPALAYLPSYFRKFGNRDVKTYTSTPHSLVNNMPDADFWTVLTSDPKRLALFDRGLSLFSALHPVVALFPFAELDKGNSASRPLAVDIGGGHGLAMLEIRKHLPHLAGDLILQDRAVVLDEISSEALPGVTKMAHDFFAPQPVQNAQVYLVRRVMHDWQDVDAARILAVIKPAMGRDSRILVSDMATPEPVGLRDAGAVWMDLMMMSIGGKERTARDWEKLAELSGLRLVKVWQEPEKFGPLCMVEYVLPDSEIGVDEDNGVQSNGVQKTNGT